MISKYTAEVFSYVPKEVKRRMVRKQNRMWSESRMIKEALLRFLPKLERDLKISPSTPENED